VRSEQDQHDAQNGRVAAGPTPGGEMSRIDAARESYPYDEVSGAHIASPPSKRLYELILGHRSGTTTVARCQRVSV
jgi:hypothetical protein